MSWEQMPRRVHLQDAGLLASTREDPHMHGLVPSRGPATATAGRPSPVRQEKSLERRRPRRSAARLQDVSQPRVVSLDSVDERAMT